MGRKNLRKNFVKECISDVHVVDLAEDGRGIGKKEGEVFFIKGAVPGEILTIEVYSRKKSMNEATIQFFQKASPVRIEPFCEHFGECGGCKWQHLEYSAQLFYKEKQVRDALERIAKIDSSLLDPVWNPILPSQESRYYRNKLEFTFSHRRWKSKSEMKSTLTEHVANLETENFEPYPDKNSEDASLISDFSPGLGFHFSGSFDRILDIKHCYLQKEPSNSLRNKIKGYAIAHAIPFFNLRNQTGLLRNLIVRTSNMEETMVILVFAQNDPKMINQVMEFINQEFPDLNSLQYIINTKKNDTLQDQEVILFRGREFIQERLGNRVFRISAKSFYQTNSTQAEKLYQTAVEMAEIEGNELVYDLYTGTGTIANYIAPLVRKVIGLEYVEDAIQDARNNSFWNSIFNTEFFTGDIKDLLSPDFLLLHGIPDLIITDPPRAGMHPDVVGALIKIRPLKIVYISCNPATQARDLLTLLEIYEIKEIRPVDMFPQTSHVENIIYLKLKSIPQ